MTGHPMSFWALVWIEGKKLFSRLLLWVELAVLALLVASLHVAIVATLQTGGRGELPPDAARALRQMLTWPDALNTALAFANGGELGGMLVAILVGAFVAQEYTWHTVHLFLSRGVSRVHFLLAKFTVVFVALALIVLTTLVAGGAVTGVYTYTREGTLGVVPVGTLAVNMARVTFTLLPYAALTFLLAVVTRSAMVAIGVGLGYSLLVENLMVEMLSLVSDQAARVARFMPTMLAKSIVQVVTGETQMNVGMNVAPSLPLLSPNVAALLLGGYTVAFLALAVWWFRRQDVTV